MKCVQYAALGLLLGVSFFSTKSIAALNAQPQVLEKFEEMLRDPGRFIGIEIWEIQNDWTDLSYVFGHVLLRLVDDDSDDSNDLLFNYYPNDPTLGSKPLLFLVPYFDVGLEVNTLSHFVDVHVGGGRGVRRIPLISNAQMRTRLLNVLGKHIGSTEARGKYMLSGNNCIGAILRAFEEAGFPRAGSMVFTPSDAISYFDKVGLSPLQPIALDRSQPLGLPFEAYQICDESKCAQSVLRSLFETQNSKNSFHKILRFRSASHLKIETRKYKSGPRQIRIPIQWRGLRESIDRHYRLVSEEYGKSL